METARNMPREGKGIKKHPGRSERQEPNNFQEFQVTGWYWILLEEYLTDILSHYLLFPSINALWRPNTPRGKAHRISQRSSSTNASVWDKKLKAGRESNSTWTIMQRSKTSFWTLWVGLVFVFVFVYVFVYCARVFTKIQLKSRYPTMPLWLSLEQNRLEVCCKLNEFLFEVLLSLALNIGSIWRC